MSPQTLPDNDPNQQLAKKLGQLLDEGKSIDALPDPLVKNLSEYRQSVARCGSKIGTPNSEKLWEQIGKDTGISSDTNTRIFSMDKVKVARYWYAAAAAVVIAALATLYLLTMQQPRLIAQTGSQISTTTLPDGSEVTLRPYSELYRLPASSGDVEYRLNGEGYFNVSNDPNRTFNVKSGSGTVTVLGTRFNLSGWGESVRVYLEEGSVQFVHNESGKSVKLEPGEAATITGQGQIPEVGRANSEEFTDWLNNRLIFENKRAAYVFEELEQHFNIRISSPREVREKRITSGGLMLDSPDTSLRYLGLVLDGSFDKISENHYQFVPEN